MNPLLHLALVAVDLLCTEKHLISDGTWDNHNSVYIAKHYITRLDIHLADADRNIVTCDLCSSERTV